MAALEIYQLSHRLVPDDLNPVDDATLKASIERAIQEEQAFVDTQLGEGRNLIVNTVRGYTRVIHRTDCPTVSHYLDRRQSWFPEGWELDDLRRNMRHGGFSPKMPVLATETEIDALKSYSACRTCQPSLKRARKINDAAKTNNVNTLAVRHIGRTFTAEGLDSPFILAKIEHTIIAEGTSTVLYDQTGPLPIAAEGQVRMLPRE